MAFTIRTATTEDAAGVQAIYAPIVRDTWISFEEEPPSVEEMAGRIAATLPHYPWLVAERDGLVAGYVYASQYKARAAYRWSAETTVYISETARRTGVATLLYKALFDDLIARGIHAAFAGIALPNAGSVGLHESLGFTPVGVFREVGFKFGDWRDVGYWQRILPKPS